jgi:hypothetical protein
MIITKHTNSKHRVLLIWTSKTTQSMRSTPTPTLCPPPNPLRRPHRCPTSHGCRCFACGCMHSPPTTPFDFGHSLTTRCRRMRPNKWCRVTAPVLPPLLPPPPPPPPLALQMLVVAVAVVQVQVVVWPQPAMGFESSSALRWRVRSVDTGGCTRTKMYVPLPLFVLSLHLSSNLCPIRLQNTPIRTRILMTADRAFDRHSPLSAVRRIARRRRSSGDLGPDRQPLVCGQQ